MLTVFNRTEVFMTYNEDNMKKVCKALEQHNFDYTLKTTKISDTYAEGQELDIAYKIYVRKDVAEKALSYIHKALFE